MRLKKRSAGYIDGKQLCSGIGSGLLMILGMSAGAASLVGSGAVSEQWMDELAALTLLLSAFMGSVVAGRGGERWKGAVCTAGGCWAAMLMCQALLFDFSLSGAAAVGAALWGGAGAAMLLVPRQRKKYAVGKRGYR